MTATVQDKVIAIIARQALLDVSDVTPASRLDEIGIDSLGMVEAIFAIEETFDISVPFNASEPGQGGIDLSSVAAVVAAVEALIAARPA